MTKTTGVQSKLIQRKNYWENKTPNKHRTNKEGEAMIKHTERFTQGLETINQNKLIKNKTKTKMDKLRLGELQIKDETQMNKWTGQTK